MPNNPLGSNPSLGQYFYAAQNPAGLFSGGNQAVVATAFTAGVPTTYTGGLVLANPTTSTANLILQKAKATFVLAQANPAAISIGVGYSTTALSGTLTAITPVPGLASSAVTPQGKLYSSASITLPVAPKIARLIGAVNTGAETTAPVSPALEDNINGAIILPPGGFAVFLSSATGTASSFFGAFSWVEFPIPH